MDDTLYLRGKRQERGDYRAKFMTDGFDRWAETSAPARIGRVEKEPASMVNTTMSGDALRRHMRKHHMMGGEMGVPKIMYGAPSYEEVLYPGVPKMPYMEGDGFGSFLSSVGKAAATGAKNVAAAATHIVKTGQKYVKKAADFYKKNEKVIKETASAIKDVADATGLTGYALEQGVKAAQKMGLMPKPPAAVEEAAFEEAEDEIEEEIEGGMRPRCPLHMSGGSAKQIKAALAQFRSRRGGAYRKPVLAYDMGMQGDGQRGTVGRARLSTRSPRGDGILSGLQAYATVPSTPKYRTNDMEQYRQSMARQAALDKRKPYKPSPSRVAGGRAPSARAAIVKQVMAERGVSLPQASRIVKEEGLY